MKIISKHILGMISSVDIKTKKSYQIQRRLKNMGLYPIYLPHKKFIDDHIVSDDGYDIPIRIFSPKKEVENPPIFLFFHGGGWVTGSIDSYTKICMHMSEITNSIVVSTEYRLAPEHQFPAALNDCVTVAKYFVKEISWLGLPIENLVLIGDSAGGNLAAAVSLYLRDHDLPMISRQILLYPLLDTNHGPLSPYTSVHENGTDYILTNKRIDDYLSMYIRTPDDLTNQYIAPMQAKTLKNQPTTLILTAEFDPLRDEGAVYGAALREAGNDVEVHCIEDAIHGYLETPIIAHTQIEKTYEYIQAFILRTTQEQE